MKIDPLRIQLDPGTFERGGSGSIFGNVRVVCGDVDFPGKTWPDFAVVILGWWVVALRSNDRHMELRFMDGPYFLRVARMGTMTLVEGIEDREKEIVRFSAKVNTRDFRNQVIAAAEAALARCRELKWTSRDVDALEKALE